MCHFYFFSSAKTNTSVVFSRFYHRKLKKTQKFRICSRKSIFTEISKKIKIQRKLKKNAKLQNMLSMKIFFLISKSIAIYLRLQIKYNIWNLFIDTKLEKTLFSNFPNDIKMFQNLKKNNY